MMAVEARCPAGHPQVVRVYPLRRDPDSRVVPVPTLFWLTCPAFSAQVARLESRGLIKELERTLAEDSALRSAYRLDHLWYIETRWSTLSLEDRDAIVQAGHLSTFRHRGIGGVRDWSTVKCLHAHIAHHRVRRSTIGSWLTDRYDLIPCASGG
jgi:hypothetical protein